MWIYKENRAFNALEKSRPCIWLLFEICSDDELHDLPEESLLYSPEKIEQKSGVHDSRPKNEIVSTLGPFLLHRTVYSVSVCLSVCPSEVRILANQLIVGSRKQCHMFGSWQDYNWRQSLCCSWAELLVWISYIYRFFCFSCFLNFCLVSCCYSILFKRTLYI